MFLTGSFLDLTDVVETTWKLGSIQLDISGRVITNKRTCVTYPSQVLLAKRGKSFDSISKLDDEEKVYFK